MSLSALLARLAAVSGCPAPRIRLPLLVPLAYAALGEYVLARFGLIPDVSVDSVRMAKQRMFYTSEKAVRELGFPQSPVTGALADAVTWFRDRGYVRGSRDAEDGWRSLSSKR
jgi:dihydroflavonol-4-reductase